VLNVALAALAASCEYVAFCLSASLGPRYFLHRIDEHLLFALILQHLLTLGDVPALYPYLDNEKIESMTCVMFFFSNKSTV